MTCPGPPPSMGRDPSPQPWQYGVVRPGGPPLASAFAAAWITGEGEGERKVDGEVFGHLKKKIMVDI